MDEQTQNHTCPACHGEGAHAEVEQVLEPCITCRGMGKIKSHIPGQPDKTCFVCKGTATQLVTRQHLEKCPVCKGSGWLDDKTYNRLVARQG